MSTTGINPNSSDPVNVQRLNDFWVRKRVHKNVRCHPPFFIRTIFYTVSIIRYARYSIFPFRFWNTTEGFSIRAFWAHEICIQVVNQSLSLTISKYVPRIENWKSNTVPLSISTTVCVSSKYSTLDSSRLLLYIHFNLTRWYYTYLLLIAICAGLKDFSQFEYN